VSKGKRILIASAVITSGCSIGYLLVCVMLIAYGASPSGNTPLDYLGYGAVFGLLMSVWFAVEVIRGKR
jgi:hypothetical protein